MRCGPLASVVALVLALGAGGGVAGGPACEYEPLPAFGSAGGCWGDYAYEDGGGCEEKFGSESEGTLFRLDGSALLFVALQGGSSCWNDGEENHTFDGMTLNAYFFVGGANAEWATRQEGEVDPVCRTRLSAGPYLLGPAPVTQPCLMEPPDPGWGDLLP